MRSGSSTLKSTCRSWETAAVLVAAEAPPPFPAPPSPVSLLLVNCRKSCIRSLSNITRAEQTAAEQERRKRRRALRGGGRGEEWEEMEREEAVNSQTPCLIRENFVKTSESLALPLSI